MENPLGKPLKDKVKIGIVSLLPNGRNLGKYTEVDPYHIEKWDEEKANLHTIVDGIFYSLIRKRKEWGLKPLPKKQLKEIKLWSDM